MILAPHLLTGAVIATKIKNLPLAIILAFLSNYLLDALPHTEYNLPNFEKKLWLKSLPDFLKVGLDFLFGASIILLLSENYFLAFTGAFFAILSDGFTFLYFIFPNSKLLKKHFDFHERFHVFNNKKTSLFWKHFCQIAITIIFIFLLS